MKPGWEVVIGLETHTQLSTASKIFSGASTAYGAAPNTQASAVDIALPGTLPVLNKGAVERAIRFGLAVGGTINMRSVFARKNYFYPDLPKGYQISQYEIPVVQGGGLTITTDAGEKFIRLTRAHLEEDAGKSLHEAFADTTGIDLNRAGTPLLEIVSEPDLRSSDEAVAYAKALHHLVVHDIQICDGNMQEGSFRCDANVSVRPAGSDKLGTRCEIKNLNSFRFMQQAIEFEIRRQIELIEDGGTVVQETRLYDPDRNETRSMRSKEDAQDYRYFPDPDLPPLVISEEWISRVRSQMPERTDTIRERYVTEDGLSEDTANQLASNRAKGNVYEHTIQAGVDTKLAANWVLGELSAALNWDDFDLSQDRALLDEIVSLLKQVQDHKITVKVGKDILVQLTGQQARGMVGLLRVDQIIEKEGLAQISDEGVIEKVVDDVLAANAAIVAEYQSGKEKAFQSLVGKAMAATKGKANPAQVNAILKRKLGR